MRIGLIPVLIFSSTLMISVKVGTVWQSVSQDSTESPGFQLPVFGKTEAVAQDEQATDDDIPSFGDEEFFDDATPADTVDEDDPLAEGNYEMSSIERQFLHDLVKRRRVLKEREQRLEEREALLRGVEKQLAEKQDRLTEIKAEIDDLLKVYQQEQRDEAKKLVNIYSNMKPKSAAQIFNDMEMDTLLAVLRGMKERKIAPIMAAMAPDKARLVTRELAEIRKLPELPQ